jgi:glycosyltransferase involved in cell wall biosynthesis
MLNSVKTITDLVVVNDTGSTDGTQELIKKFGLENNIPTYVFERPFDDFEICNAKT